MNTIEGNKLIAEFMGGKWNKTSGWEFSMFNSPLSHCGNKLRFDSSWDWLMRVVEKIYGLNIYYEYVYKTSGQFGGGIELSTNINSVWEAVVDFIEWYNKNNC